MNSLLLLFLLAVIMSSFTYLKLQCGGNPSHLHPFDVNATLPIRGILAVLIVCFHLGLRFEGTPMDMFSSFGNPVVSIFFFISGYGLMISYLKKGDSYLQNFFQKRLSKLLPVLIVLSIVGATYQHTALHYSVSEILDNLLSGEPPLPYSWFIYAIIYQYITFYIACKISHTSGQCILITLLMTLAIMCATHMAYWGSWWRISQPSFVLGMTVVVYEETFRQALVKRPFVITFTVLLLILAGIIIPPTHLATYVYSNLMPFPILFTVYAFGAIGHKVWRFLGGISLEVYLVHGLSIWGMYHSSVTLWYTFTVCNFAISIPAAIFIRKLEDRIIPHPAT